MKIKDINWESQWQNKLEKRKNNRNWDDIANKFGKWIEDDDYPEKLIKHINLKETDTVLDLGCGEGSITIPLAKKAKEVLAIDKSEKMLKILKEKSKKEGLNNIKTLNEDIFNINQDKIGTYDIIIASRSISGTYHMKKLLETLNEISEKYVYLTLYGPNNKKEANKALKYIKKPIEEIPHYSLIFNLLVSMNINPNATNLECESVKSYNSLEEAIERFKWKMGDINQEQEEKLNKYLKNKFIKNKEEKWENPEDKSDWVLIWWKK